MDHETNLKIVPANKLILVLFLLSTIPLTLFIDREGVNKTIIVFLLAPVLLIFIYSVKAAISVVILSFFIELHFYYFSISEILSIIIIIAFLVTQKFRFKDFRSNILIPFSIFICALIPSYINSSNLAMSLLLSSRLLAFFLIFTLTGTFLKKYSQFSYIINLFLFGAAVNGLFVIYEAVITGRRVFGFSGIMYVDLVSIALLISFLSFLYLKKKRMRYAILSILFLSALIFTQTRGIWLMAGITMALIMFQAFLQSKRIGISKLKMLFIVIISAMTISAVVMLLQSVNPKTLERVTVQKNEQVGVGSASTGSLVTRYFIWRTALNAFNAHPITGIGLYTFPFSSSAYADFDSAIYKLFVERLTAHTTILAFLAETGLIGFAGFLFFLFTTLFFAKKASRNSKTGQQWYFSQLIFWILVYISFSMIITDAWLWGTLLIVWSIMTGLSNANQNIILKNQEVPEQ